MFRESNHIRDNLAVDLVDYLQSQPWWQRSNGKDHVVALGRTAWDFMRDNSGPDFGANNLLNLPRVQNMSVLTVERQPWKGSNQYEKYSVYLDEKGDGRKRIERRWYFLCTYAHPNASDAGFKDAVDVALILSRLVQENVKNSDKEVPMGLLDTI
ncbi:hypothetical protein L6164_001043 [Bauhinia variegata]|uniref:Uncharacterized protein n=1 Tax=Bauhinia variegata TaxID=167791 RepID=A0ACB9Q7W5_BAUVA|nr:hypothetical protein L6164_001043 [Bauhinia variegata]